MFVDLTVEDSVYCRVTSQHAQSNQQLGGGYLFQTIEAGYGVGQSTNCLFFKVKPAEFNIIIIYEARNALYSLVLREVGRRGSKKERVVRPAYASLRQA